MSGFQPVLTYTGILRKAGHIVLEMEGLPFSIPNPANITMPSFVNGIHCGFGSPNVDPFFFARLNRYNWGGVYCNNQTSLADKGQVWCAVDGKYAYFTHTLPEQSTGTPTVVSWFRVPPPKKNAFDTYDVINLAGTVLPPLPYDEIQFYAEGSPYSGGVNAFGYFGPVLIPVLYLADIVYAMPIDYGVSLGVPQPLPDASPYRVGSVVYNNDFMLGITDTYPPTLTMGGFTNGIMNTVSFDDANLNDNFATYGAQSLITCATGFILTLVSFPNGTVKYLYIFIPADGTFTYYTLEFVATDAPSLAVLGGDIGNEAFSITTDLHGDVFLSQSVKSIAYAPNQFTILVSKKSLIQSQLPLAIPFYPCFNFTRLCCNTANGTR